MAWSSASPSSNHSGVRQYGPSGSNSSSSARRSAVGGLHHVHAVDAEHVKDREREADQIPAVQDALREQLEPRATVVAEDNQLAVEHEPSGNR